jgi:NADPH-dependent dioxygenase
MFAKKSPEVLVVGAGPVGLLAAVALAARGVQVQIVDRDWRTGAHSYALALHPSSLELLDRLGLADEVLKKAYRVDTVGLYDGHECRRELEIADVAGRFPFVAVMPQDALELTLENALRELEVEVLWNHEVAELTPHADHVAVTINQLEKESVGYGVAHTEWVVRKTVERNVPLVIGADGHRSLVRRSLGIEFAEVGPAQNFAVFEFRSDADFGQQMPLVMADRLVSGLWPLPDGYCRWSFQLGDVHVPVSSRQKRRVAVEIGSTAFPVLDAEFLARLIAQRAPWFDARIDEIRWQIAVRFERRLASRFGEGRLWLAGDAGHMTGPVGMHSMNVGLREAHELAHLVEDALSGGLSPDAWDAYNDRRIAEWRRLLGLDDGLKPTEGAEPWLCECREDLLSCLPVSGEDLATLTRQLGFAG